MRNFLFTENEDTIIADFEALDPDCGHNWFEIEVKVDRFYMRDVLIHIYFMFFLLCDGILVFLASLVPPVYKGVLWES